MQRTIEHWKVARENKLRLNYIFMLSFHSSVSLSVTRISSNFTKCEKEKGKKSLKSNSLLFIELIISEMQVWNRARPRHHCVVISCCAFEFNELMFSSSTEFPLISLLFFSSSVHLSLSIQFEMCRRDDVEKVQNSCSQLRHSNEIEWQLAQSMRARVKTEFRSRNSNEQCGSNALTVMRDKIEYFFHFVFVRFADRRRFIFNSFFFAFVRNRQKRNIKYKTQIDDDKDGENYERAWVWNLWI